MNYIDVPVVYHNDTVRPADKQEIECGRTKTIASSILEAHDTKSEGDSLHLRFDSLTSHDITCVGIIQTARASGLTRFPVPYVLTNCHNSLCAVGGTINEDDHQFALSAARKYGGIYVPPCYAVIHSYNREMMSGCGRMILGSDSHTRYGALGTMGIGEGGGELAKQLLNRTYDIKKPEVVLVHVTGKVKPWIGPHDVALALVQATYSKGLVKNKILEFAGSGIANLSQDFRNGIDVMTTETTCLSSIWETDDITRAYYVVHGRESAYHKLTPEDNAVYDACIELNLDEIECMIALPMHPSHALPVLELKKDPYTILKQAEEEANASLHGVTMHLLDKIAADGTIRVQQGIIAGCSGGIYENIVAASQILSTGNTGNGTFRLSVYPDSMPCYKALVENGTVASLMESGAILREAFCGPCFGAGDTPADQEFSIRHTTRNFPNREGSKPTEGQISGVALMDARSIAATALHQGVLTSAEELHMEPVQIPPCPFDAKLYQKRVYDGTKENHEQEPLHFGPNIKDWPEQPALSNDLLICIASSLKDEVTTTDELIPSGETSSYRSNPLRLAEFTLSRKDPGYVQRAHEIFAMEKERRSGQVPELMNHVYALLKQHGLSVDEKNTQIGSAVYARKPGDGSAREQAASCQRVLGGCANFAKSYATRRYRANCINWGILPFIMEDEEPALGDMVYIRSIRDSLLNDLPVEAYLIHEDTVKQVQVSLGDLEGMEKDILSAGCLINYYKH